MNKLLLCAAVMAAVALGSGTGFADNHGGKHKGPKKMHPKMPSFEVMDGNSDGTVSLDEFGAAHAKWLEQKFQRIDKNKDGGLTKDELGKARSKMKKNNMGKKEKHQGKHEQH